ncbi:MAG: hypothetical protein M3458_19525 [Acidobacteriota bacterium]|nr:hypothetical protein [Acidobacteriota bacterium]
MQQVNRTAKLCALLLVLSAAFLVSGYATANNMQEQDMGDLRLDAQIKKRYLLGEEIPVVFSLINRGADRQKVRDIAMTKFRLTLRGTFDEEEGSAVRERVYDGTHGVGYTSTTQGGTTEWGTVNKPDVVLGKGEGTQLEIGNISGMFEDVPSRLNPGNYTLTAEYEDGQKVTRKFKVVVDPEKTVPMLAAKLKSKEDTDRNWAFHHLSRIDEQKLIEVLEEQRHAGDESLRRSAESYLDTLDTMKRHAQEQEAAKKKRVS